MSDERQSEEAPLQTPFFRATESVRYQRQEEIRRYETSVERSLVAFWGPIEPRVITPFADAVNDVPIGAPFDLMLTSLGGDAETAIRMASMCHAEREDFR